jgi:hypothetical protein
MCGLMFRSGTCIDQDMCVLFVDLLFVFFLGATELLCVFSVSIDKLIRYTETEMLCIRDGGLDLRGGQR